MNVPRLVARLEQFGNTLPVMVGGLTADEARWKPATGAWSILEIVNHLVDEEIDDFRARLFLALQDPAAPWPAIDPERWARERNYNQRDLTESVHRFVKERGESIMRLRNIRNPDWNVVIDRPNIPMRPGDLLVSWAAHDALHIRQIAKRLHELATEDGKPEGFSTGYAGEWRA